MALHTPTPCWSAGRRDSVKAQSIGYILLLDDPNNKTLKTMGDCFEHNDGHGKQSLANLLASLILLAMLTHTLLDLDYPR